MCPLIIGEIRVWPNATNVTVLFFLFNVTFKITAINQNQIIDESDECVNDRSFTQVTSNFNLVIVLDAITCCRSLKVRILN